MTQDRFNQCWFSYRFSSLTLPNCKVLLEKVIVFHSGRRPTGRLLSSAFALIDLLLDVLEVAMHLVVGDGER